jgi:hypothetical protein
MAEIAASVEMKFRPTGSVPTVLPSRGSYCVRTGSGTYAAGYAGKGLELGTNYSSPSISKVKNSWSYVHFVHLHGVILTTCIVKFQCMLK